VGSESPPGAFLPTGLAVLSAAVAPRMVMRWGVAHSEHMNIWLLNVGLSALARKTSGLSGLHRAVAWMRSDGLDLVRTLSASRISDAGLVASLDVVGEETAREQERVKAATPKGEPVPEVEEVVRLVPLSWVLLLNEVAPVWTEDGAGWAMDAQRLLLQIYDGYLSSTTRATKVPPQACCVTALGNIPPGVLREQTTLGMLSSGFVGRWLVIPTPAPDEMVSFPCLNGGDPLADVRRDVEQMMHLAKRTTRVEVNRLWNQRALEFRAGWYRLRWERYVRGSPDDPLEAGSAELWGRQQATAVKVATLLAVSRQIDEIESLEEVEVGAEDVEWACEVVDASIQYVTETLRESGAESRSRAGRIEGRILRYLTRKEASSLARGVTLTHLTDATKGSGASREDIVRGVDALLQSGHIEVADDGRRRLVWLAASGDTVAP
jgi:hypothetical protein